MTSSLWGGEGVSKSDGKVTVGGGTELQILSGIPKKEVQDSIWITENTSGFLKDYEKK